MKGEARKAAIAAYKERKAVAGVYAVRCEGSAEVWVGQWLDVETIKTRIWFGLRQGGNPNRAMLAAWQKHGEASFSFEVLETHEDNVAPYIRADALKKRAAHWCEALSARPI